MPYNLPTKPRTPAQQAALDERKKRNAEKLMARRLNPEANVRQPNKYWYIWTEEK